MKARQQKADSASHGGWSPAAGGGVHGTGTGTAPVVTGVGIYPSATPAKSKSKLPFYSGIVAIIGEPNERAELEKLARRLESAGALPLLPSVWPGDPEWPAPGEPWRHEQREKITAAARRRVQRCELVLVANVPPTPVPGEPRYPRITSGMRELIALAVAADTPVTYLYPVPEPGGVV